MNFEELSDQYDDLRDAALKMVMAQDLRSIANAKEYLQATLEHHVDVQPGDMVWTNRYRGIAIEYPYGSYVVIQDEITGQPQKVWLLGILKIDTTGRGSYFNNIDVS
jgi:hypothetical protein